MKVEVFRDSRGRYIGRERVWTDGLTLVLTFPVYCRFGLELGNTLDMVVGFQPFCTRLLFVAMVAFGLRFV